MYVCLQKYVVGGVLYAQVMCVHVTVCTRCPLMCRVVAVCVYTPYVHRSSPVDLALVLVALTQRTCSVANVVQCSCQWEDRFVNTAPYR